MAPAVTHAEPVLPGPIRPRSPIAHTPPRTVTAEPTVAASALACTRCRGGTTCGNPAESPASTNLLSPVTSNAPRYSGAPATPDPTAIATSAIGTPRSTFAMIRIRRRSQRSSSAPANGPTREYGSSKTASPAATAIGLAWRSGLNNTAPPSPAWNTPSPHCAAKRETSNRPNPRVASSRRIPSRSVTLEQTMVCDDVTSMQVSGVGCLVVTLWCAQR
jgi:hypothetical protein